MSKRKDAGIGEICTSKPTWFDSRLARDQRNVGQFIAAKRREKNLTQEQVTGPLAKMQKMERTCKYAMSTVLVVIGFLSLVTVSLFGGTHFGVALCNIFSGLAADAGIGLCFATALGAFKQEQ